MRRCLAFVLHHGHQQTSCYDSDACVDLVWFSLTIRILPPIYFVSFLKYKVMVNILFYFLLIKRMYLYHVLLGTNGEPEFFVYLFWHDLPPHHRPQWCRRCFLSEFLNKIFHWGLLLWCTTKCTQGGMRCWVWCVCVFMQFVCPVRRMNVPECTFPQFNWKCSLEPINRCEAG